MPFENGTVNASFFTYTEELPSDFAQLFANHRACNVEQINDEVHYGWVTSHHLFDTDITEESLWHGAFLRLGLRKSERKIPAAYLNALCSQEEHAARITRKLEYVPKKLKQEIKEDIIDKNLMKMPPSISSIPVVICPNEKIIMIGATSNAQIDLFIEYFITATNIEPILLSPGYYLERNFNKLESELNNINFAKDKVDEMNICREFLTWLWYYSETAGNLNDERYGDFDIFIEGPLTMAYTAESQGAAETVIKNGEAPQRSAEAKAALLTGKKLRKAKFSITNYEKIFVGNFDADKFTVSSLNLPEGEKSDDFARIEERIENLVIFQKALELYFNKFIETLISDDFEKIQEEIQQWVLDRDEI